MILILLLALSVSILQNIAGATSGYTVKYNALKTKVGQALKRRDLCTNK